MIKALHLSLTAVVICAALHDKSERKSPVGPRDRERKPGVSFPFGEGIPQDQSPSRLGDCLRNHPRADQSADWSGLDRNCPAELR